MSLLNFFEALSFSLLHDHQAIGVSVSLIKGRKNDMSDRYEIWLLLWYDVMIYGNEIIKHDCARYYYRKKNTWLLLWYDVLIYGNEMKMILLDVTDRKNNQNNWLLVGCDVMI